MDSKLTIFLKGILMGLCDIVPGISGGTIAFITGIYERLIKAVDTNAHYFLTEPIAILTRKKKFSLPQTIKELEANDLGFLIVLLAGIGTSIFLGSKIILYALETYYAYTIAFFIGLILASAMRIFEEIKSHETSKMLFGVLGFIIGIGFAFIVPLNTEPSILYIFLAGFLSLSAMFLPGISGSFILFVMGVYEFLIKNVLYNLVQNIHYAIVFALGAITGAIVISKVITWSFAKDKSKTLYLLLGLVIGSLSVPAKKIADTTALTTETATAMAILIALGAAAALLINRVAEKKENTIPVANAHTK